MNARDIVIAVLFWMIVAALWMLGVLHAMPPTATPVPHPTATRRAAGLGRVPMKMIMNPDPSKKDKPWR